MTAWCDADTTCPDDAEYLKQGDLERQVQNLFNNRYDWIKDYMEQLRMQTQLALQERPEIKSEQELTILTELDEWMLMYERLVLEWMFVIEMQKWESKLLEEHIQMAERIISRRRFNSSLEELNILERRLKNDWETNAWARFNPSKGSIMERLEPTTSQGLKDEREISRFWRDAMNDLQQCWRDLVPFDGSAGTSLTDITITKAAPRFQFIDDQIRITLQHHIGDGIKDRIQRLYKCKMMERERRIQGEVEDRAHRFAGGLANCDKFRTSSTIARLTLSRSKWMTMVDIPKSDMLVFGEAVTRALRRNDSVVHVQFQVDINSDMDLAEAITMVQDMVSLTTLSFVSKSKGLGIGMSALAALAEVVQHNTNIVSICGEGTQLQLVREALSRRHSIPNKQTSISVHGFLLDGGALHSREASRIQLRFVGPRKGTLVLKLCHRSKETQLVEVNSETAPERYTVSRLASFMTERIQLIPNTHFTPGSITTISIVPSQEDYQLLDVDLSDEYGIPYAGPDGNPDEEDDADLELELEVDDDENHETVPAQESSEIDGEPLQHGKIETVE